MRMIYKGKPNANTKLGGKLAVELDKLNVKLIKQNKIKPSVVVTANIRATVSLAKALGYKRKDILRWIRLAWRTTKID